MGAGLIALMESLSLLITAQNALPMYTDVLGPVWLGKGQTPRGPRYNPREI